MFSNFFQSFSPANLIGYVSSAFLRLLWLLFSKAHTKEEALPAKQRQPADGALLFHGHPDAGIHSIRIPTGRGSNAKRLVAIAAEHEPQFDGPAPQDSHLHHPQLLGLRGGALRHGRVRGANAHQVDRLVAARSLLQRSDPGTALFNIYIVRWLVEQMSLTMGFLKNVNK